jgi:hypothetical protein
MQEERTDEKDQSSSITQKSKGHQSAEKTEGHRLQRIVNTVVFLL